MSDKAEMEFVGIVWRRSERHRWYIVVGSDAEREYLGDYIAERSSVDELADALAAGLEVEP